MASAVLSDDAPCFHPLDESRIGHSTALSVTPPPSVGVPATGRLLRVAILHRHGARGPSQSALAPFLAVADSSAAVAGPAGAGSAATQWRPNEAELLTSTGVAQCQALGRWFGSVYLKELRKLNKSFSSDPRRCKWRSSKVDRVVTSGAHFWVGFRGKSAGFDDEDSSATATAASAGGKVESEDVLVHVMSQELHTHVQKGAHGVHGHPEAISPQKLWPYDGDSDDWFRVWNKHPDFLASWQALKQGAKFIERAREHNSFLNDVLIRLKANLAVKAEADDDKTLAKKLNIMTYVWELLDCETFFPEKRDAILNVTSPEDRERIEELARWIWGQRFFHTGPQSAPGSNYGRLIGGRLLAEVVSDLADDRGHDSQPCFAVYSGHDYSLLAVLAALGLREYEGRVLGYCATLGFELWEVPTPSGDGTRQLVRILLNSHPFEDDAHKPTDTVHWRPLVFRPRYFPGDLCPLSTLTARVD